MLGEPSLFVVSLPEGGPTPVELGRRLERDGRYVPRPGKEAEVRPPPPWIRAWGEPDSPVVHCVWPARPRGAVLLEPCGDPRCGAQHGGVLGGTGAGLAVSTMLDAARPLESWVRQFRFVVEAAGGAVPLWDNNALRTLSAERVAALARGEQTPDARDVQAIHAVFSEAVANEAWLHTHGLQRFGLPDLELLRWPWVCRDEGGDLLNALAERFLERGMPSARLPFDVVGGGTLAWIPLAEALERLLPQEIGAARDRHESDHEARAVLTSEAIAMTPRPHVPVGAAVSESAIPAEGGASEGVFLEAASPAPFEPPLVAAATFARDNDLAAGFKAGARSAAKARRTWSAFRRYFARHHAEPDWCFVVDLVYPHPRCGHPHAMPHHLHAIDEAGGLLLAGAIPISDPPDPDGVGGDALGEEPEWHPIDRLGGWMVVHGADGFGPDDCLAGRR
jgi:hypothetical protein